MHSKKSRKKMYSLEMTTDSINEPGTSSFRKAKVTPQGENKMNLRNRKVNDSNQIFQDELPEDNLLQKEKDDLFMALEMSRISAQRESALRNKPKLYTFGNSKKLTSFRVSDFDAEDCSKTVENSLDNDNEDTQLSCSQPLFDSPQEENSSSDEQLSPILINKTNDNLPGTWKNENNNCQGKRFMISEEVLSVLPSKIRKISESSESNTRSPSPVFGLEKLPEKQLINLRKENVKVIMKHGIFYAPFGANLSNYAVHIMNLFNKYETDLRTFQSQSFHRLSWPKPIIEGLCFPNTLHLRRRGEKKVLDIEDNDDNDIFENPKNKNAKNRFVKKNIPCTTLCAESNSKPLVTVKLNEDNELPDLNPEPLFPDSEESSSQDFADVKQLQKDLNGKSSNHANVNLVGTTLQDKNKDTFFSCLENLLENTQSSNVVFITQSPEKIESNLQEVLSSDEMRKVHDSNQPDVELCDSPKEKITTLTSLSQSPCTSSQVMENTVGDDDSSKICTERKLLSSQNDPSPLNTLQEHIACPMCNLMFSLTDIEEHAAYCQGPTEGKREIKRKKHKGLTMEHILQEIHREFSPQDRDQITDKYQKRRKVDSPSDHENFSSDKADLKESLEKCYICKMFFPEGKPYRDHVDQCILADSVNNKSSDSSKSPMSKNNLILLEQLENNINNDNLPAMEKAEDGNKDFCIMLDQSNNDDISELVINSSPIKSFCAISQQEDNLIDYSKQFKCKSDCGKMKITKKFKKYCKKNNKNIFS